MRPLRCLIFTCRCREAWELQLRLQCSWGQGWRSMMSLLHRLCSFFTSLVSPRSARANDSNSSCIICNSPLAVLTCDSRKACAWISVCSCGETPEAGRGLLVRRRVGLNRGKGRTGRRFVEFVKSLSTAYMRNKKLIKELCQGQHNDSSCLVKVNLSRRFQHIQKKGRRYNIPMLKYKSEKVFCAHLVRSSKLPRDFFMKGRKDSAREHYSQPRPQKLPHPPTLTHDQSFLFTFRCSNSTNNIFLPNKDHSLTHAASELLPRIKLPPLRQPDKENHLQEQSMAKWKQNRIGSNDRLRTAHKRSLRL